MPVIQVNVKLTEEERDLLRRRAKAENVSEAEYLRICMIIDSVVSGDVGALKITGRRMREAFGARLATWRRKGLVAL